MEESRSQPPAAPADPRFGLLKLVVSKASMRETQVIVPAEPAPKSFEMNVALGVRIAMAPELKQAEVTLMVKVTPDQAVRPYEIEVHVLGHFGVKDGSLEQLDQFAKNQAPVILFPYVRQVVHSLTLDGRYGAIRLDPINIRATLGADDWVTDDDEAAAVADGKPDAP
jgi:preprotein translocase subunit SecB